MCLPDFKEFRQIDKSSPLIGYRNWRNKIKDSLILSSLYQDYEWDNIEGSHEVLNEDSGIYAYNYNKYDNYNNYNNYNYDDYYYNYYNVGGIISQWGKVAIHSIGQRSEYARIDKLFTIRELDAVGSNEFLDWIKIFNKKIGNIAEKYECKTIHYQDFVESQA